MSRLMIKSEASRLAEAEPSKLNVSLSGFLLCHRVDRAAQRQRAVYRSNESTDHPNEQLAESYVRFVVIASSAVWVGLGKIILLLVEIAANTRS